jgi:hypothetical protein
LPYFASRFLFYLVVVAAWDIFRVYIDAILPQIESEQQWPQQQRTQKPKSAQQTSPRRLTTRPSGPIKASA